VDQKKKARTQKTEIVIITNYTQQADFIDQRAIRAG
jgi:hypothetical protein